MTVAHFRPTARMLSFVKLGCHAVIIWPVPDETSPCGTHHENGGVTTSCAAPRRVRDSRALSLLPESFKRPHRPCDRHLRGVQVHPQSRFRAAGEIEHDLKDGVALVGKAQEVIATRTA